MKKKSLIVFASLLLVSCVNYDSEDYWAEEEKAIGDLILILTDAEYYIDMNDDSLSIIYLYDDLLTPSAQHIEEEFAFDKSARRKFKPFIENEIKERKIDIHLKFEEVEVKTLSINKYESVKSIIDSNNVRDIKEFGILRCSRIIFNSYFNNGYLYYSFDCGNGCAWGGFIEIKKVNKQWKAVQMYTGWRA